MLIESYVIGFICCTLNIREIQVREGDNWTRANSILTLVLYPILILFPFVSAIFMLKNWNKLRHKRFN